MSDSMEQPTQTPRRHKHKVPKENARMTQNETGQVVATPNATKSHQNHRAKSRDTANKNLTSPTHLPETIMQSVERLDLGTGGNQASQKKKQRYRKRTGEGHAPEHININQPQSPPIAHAGNQSTPVKPQQMYAGPTFHSSPAPSSLPMPKFFAQAMAAGKPSEPVRTPSDDSSGESSSQHGGDSPTLRNSLRVLANDHPREASPLDIFFNADRQEKAARARLSGTFQDRSKSASPGHDSTFQSPFAKPATPSSEDQNYAKTLALKQLLLFPQAQKSTTPMDSAQSSPFLDIPYRPSAGRASSEVSTPTVSSLNLNKLASEKQSFYDSPSLSSPLYSNRGNQTRRPLPHHLRQEFLKSLPLDQSPAVPSQSAQLASTNKV